MGISDRVHELQHHVSLSHRLLCSLIENLAEKETYRQYLAKRGESIKTGEVLEQSCLSSTATTPLPRSPFFYTGCC